MALLKSYGVIYLPINAAIYDVLQVSHTLSISSVPSYIYGPIAPHCSLTSEAASERQDGELLLLYSTGYQGSKTLTSRDKVTTGFQ